MKNTKAITYSAVCCAISLVCMTISRFLPLRITPLMVCGICFFIAFCCNFAYGFLSILATLLLSFFMLGGINGTFLFTAFVFAPYSLLAFALKRFNYKTIKGTLIRLFGVVAAFNLLFMTIALGFGKVLLEQVILGFDASELLSKFGSKGALYATVALAATALMIGYDYMFVLAEETLNNRIKFRKVHKDAPKDDQDPPTPF